MKNVGNAVKVYAPASVGNMVVGFDILGFAVNAPGDEVIARKGERKGLHITKIFGDKKNLLPKIVERNTAGLGALELLKFLGMQDECIDLEIYKKMPFGSGMGSSAASAAAGVMAINELLGRPLSKKELARFAIIGESAADGAMHGDNVLPSLLGGIVLIRDNKTYDFVSLPVPKGLSVFLIYPHIEILTREARGVLGDTVSLNKVIAQTGNIASLVTSLFNSDFDLLKRSLVDHIIEPQRAKLIPHFYELKDIALSLGALNYSISGAGPSMFGFALNNVIAEEITTSISSWLHNKGIRTNTYISPINTTGAYKM